MPTDKSPEADAECIGWTRLKKRVLERDSYQCRNCSSEKYLEVHHWRPLPEESEGIDRYGYRIGDRPLIVPESGLVTLCTICHSALTEARKIVRLSENSSLLGDVQVPDRDYHNIFELWVLNGRELPMKVMRETWTPSANHFLMVERIEIRKWPYGLAWGCYHRDGTAHDEEKIRSAGSYQWKRVD